MQVIFNAITWPAATPIGLCIAFTWLIVTGRLVPKSTVKQLAAEQQARIEFMESSSIARETTIATLVDQNAKLQLQGELAVELLRSLQSITAEGNSRPRSGHVAAED